MGFFNINSNIPLDENTPIVSCKIQGQEIISMMPDGMINVKGIKFSDGTSITSSAVDGDSVGDLAIPSPSGGDGGNF